MRVRGGGRPGDADPPKWLLGGMLACFGAGALLRTGLAAGDRSARGPSPEYVLYVRQLTDRYGIDRKQVEQVRMIQAARTAEYLRVLLADQGRLPIDLRDEVADADRRAQERIKSVLTEEQRRRFLRDSTPELLAPAGGASGGGSTKR